MSTAIARNLMAEMKLLGMFEAFDRLVTQATRDQWGCSDFLDAMLQAESDFRTERKTKRRIKAAKFALRPPSRTSTSRPTARLPKLRSKSSTACTGSQRLDRFC
jgi:IstB-like ATP binding protein